MTVEVGAGAVVVHGGSGRAGSVVGVGHRADALGRELGCAVSIKHETANPVGSFKGRGTEVVASGLPFLDLDIEIRKLPNTTNAIESLNARFRKAVATRGDFPNEQAALKVLYLAVRVP